MKRFFVACFICLFAFSLFAQDDSAVAAASNNSSETTVTASASTAASTKLSSKEKKALKKAEKEAKKATKKAEKEAKKAQKKAGKNNKATEKAPEAAKTPETTAAKQNTEGSASSLGWIEAKKKNTKEIFGNFQLNIKAKYGSYSISAINGQGKATPLLSVSNEYTKNGFYLKVGRKIYSLFTDPAVKPIILRKTTGTGIKYTVSGTAEVLVSFDFYPFNSKDVTNVVKVSATIKNISKRPDDFSFKAIFDTVLGESAAYHFYTADGVPVKKEVIYRTLQNQKYFISSNDYATMHMFFTGADCTVPDVLALANYSTLDTNVWEPSMTLLRDFDTVFSYNNSAVCAIWKPVRLAQDESYTLVFYLAASSDGMPLDVAKYFYESDKKVEKQPVDEGLVKEVFQDERMSYAATQRIAADVVPEPVEEKTVPVKEEVPREVPTVDFYIKNITKEQLSPEYIQALLDRISALEEDSPSLNRQELLALNTELDAILTYLRQ